MNGKMNEIRESINTLTQKLGAKEQKKIFFFTVHTSVAVAVTSGH